VQLSARQQEKLPGPPIAPQASDLPLDPFLRTVSFSQSYQGPQNPVIPSSSAPFNVEENWQYEAAISASLESMAANLYPETLDEDQQQYSARIAVSLGLPDALSYQASTSSQPPTFSGSVSTASVGLSRPVTPMNSYPSTTPSTKVRTIPYHPPNIKQHMSEDWMRPTEDKTTTPRRVRINLDNRFSLVFWHEVRR
jgi:hypothetical protein